MIHPKNFIKIIVFFVHVLGHIVNSKKKKKKKKKRTAYLCLLIVFLNDPSFQWDIEEIYKNFLFAVVPKFLRLLTLSFTIMQLYNGLNMYTQYQYFCYFTAHGISDTRSGMV